jgi:hypothetical protein
MKTFDLDLLSITKWAVKDVYPHAGGDELADLIKTTLIEAENLIEKDEFRSSEVELHHQLVAHLAATEIQPGIAQNTARLDLYHDWCWE